MATSYFKGSKSLNHVLGGVSHSKGYYNGNLVINEVSKTSVNISITGYTSSGRINFDSSARVASNVLVYVQASYSAYFKDSYTGDTYNIDYTGVVMNGSLYKGSSFGSVFVYLNPPSGYILMYIRYNSMPEIINISPTSDNINNYTF